MGAYAIGIGGTGARCIESLIHHCAAGLGPDKLFVLLIDPDEANGNLNRVRQLVTRYMSCRDMFHPGSGSGLFKTELRCATDGKEPMLVWSPTAHEPTLSDFFGYDTLPAELKNLGRLLYTQDELAMNLELGFRGHSSVGAPVMARLQTVLDQRPWAEIIEEMQQEIGRGENVTLFTYASIFGATGASGFPTVARILRRATKDWPNADHVRLGGNLLLPYFGFRRGDQTVEELSARAELFLINAKAALNHYNYEWRTDAYNPYDALYFLGESKPDAEGRDFALGGQSQTNPAHYIEILSAQAALHFFESHGVAQAALLAGGERQKFFAGRAADGVIRWEDLPQREDFRERLLFLSSLAAAYLHFYFPLVTKPTFESERNNNPWYAKNFSAGALSAGPENTMQKVFREYCLLLANWLYETHAFAGGRDLLLLNQAVLTRAQRMGFDHWPTEDFALLKHCGPTDPRPRSRRPYEDVYDRLNKLTAAQVSHIETPTGRFLDMLYQAVDGFCRQHYQMRARVAGGRNG